MIWDWQQRAFTWTSRNSQFLMSDSQTDQNLKKKRKKNVFWSRHPKAFLPNLNSNPIISAKMMILMMLLKESISSNKASSQEKSLYLDSSEKDQVLLVNRNKWPRVYPANLMKDVFQLIMIVSKDKKKKSRKMRCQLPILVE